MKKFLAVTLLIFSFFIFSAVFSNVDAVVRVRGYYKRNGTYVQPHYRSDPNRYKSDNWSSKGNYNPYTGKIGSRSWDW